MKKILQSLCLASLAGSLFASTDTDRSIWTVMEKPSPDSPPIHQKIDNWSIRPGDWFVLTNLDTQKSYWVHKSELDKKNIQLQCTSEQTNQGQTLHYRNTTVEKWNNTSENMPEPMKAYHEWMQQIQQSIQKIFNMDAMHTYQKLRMRLHKDLRLFNDS